MIKSKIILLARIPCFVSKQVIRISGMYSNWCLESSLSSAFFKIWFLKNKETKTKMHTSFLVRLQDIDFWLLVVLSSPLPEIIQLNILLAFSLKSCRARSWCLSQMSPLKHIHIFFIESQNLQNVYLQCILMNCMITQLCVRTMMLQTLTFRLAATGKLYLTKIESEICKR